VLDSLHALTDKMAETLFSSSTEKADYQTTVNFLKKFERECSSIIEQQ
jgi:hypothetical protein